MTKLNNKLEQIKALQKNTDKGPQYFINEAYRILGNPIILYDIDWKILGCAENVVTDDPLWNNHVNGMINKNRDIFKDEGFIDIIIRPEKVVLLRSKELKYNRIFGKIFNEDGVLMAGISVVACNKPFDDDDFMAVEAMCKICSKEICKIPYYQTYPQKILDTYINMIIDGEVKDKTYISGYIEMVYKGLENNLYLAVADISQCDPTHAKLDYYRGLFKRTRPAFKYSVYSNRIIIIMSMNEKIFHPKRVFNRLNRVIEENNIKVGVSSCFENLFELRRYYVEAVNALDNGLKSNRNQWIFLYDED